jgi:hypothetical protein
MSNPSGPSDSFRMNKHQNQSGAHPKRTIPVPKIVKLGPGPSLAAHAQPAKPGQPLKPANVMKAVHKEKHAPWLTTAKIPRNTIPRIP